MKRTMQANDGREVAVPHLDQYFGLWAVEPRRFEAMCAAMQRMDLAGHVAAAGPIAADSPILIEGGVEIEVDPQSKLTIVGGETALIQLRGVLTKMGSSMAPGGSMLMARRRLALALREERVKSILLVIDSPGGTVAGTEDLAEEIAAADRVKPVTAFIEDLGASGAYWLASQAGRVWANAAAQMGSIGVFMAVDDFSGMYAQAGIKTYLIKAGEMKRAGLEGTEITEAQRAEWQRLVTEIYGRFTGAVARGRGMSEAQARELGDGRMWGSGDALAKGLIDGTATLAEAVKLARQERTDRLWRAERIGREGQMNFMESLKAVMDGRPGEAHEDHRGIAEEAMWAVRAHDTPDHAAEVAAAEEKGRRAGAEASAAEQVKAALENERGRAAQIIEICGKLNLRPEQVIEHIKNGASVKTVALASIEQAAAAQPAIPAQRDYHAEQPGEQGAGDEGLKKAAEAQAAAIKG